MDIIQPGLIGVGCAVRWSCGARGLVPAGLVRSDLVLLSDPGFVLPPDLYRGAGRQVRLYLANSAGKFD